MHPFLVSLRLGTDTVKLLVTDSNGDRLKARLPIRAEHPRALLTLLEGLALWSGHLPLCAATSVAATAPRSAVAALFGADLWPTESTLVRFDLLEPREPHHRIRGLGDFRSAHRDLAGRSA